MSIHCHDDMVEVKEFLAHQNRPRKLDALNAQLDPELTAPTRYRVVDVLAFIQRKRFVLQKLEAKEKVQVARARLQRVQNIDDDTYSYDQEQRMIEELVDARTF